MMRMSSGSEMRRTRSRCPGLAGFRLHWHIGRLVQGEGSGWAGFLPRHIPSLCPGLRATVPRTYIYNVCGGVRARAKCLISASIAPARLQYHSGMFWLKNIYRSGWCDRGAKWRFYAITQVNNSYHHFQNVGRRVWMFRYLFAFSK